MRAKLEFLLAEPSEERCPLLVVSMFFSIIPILPYITPILRYVTLGGIAVQDVAMQLVIIHIIAVCGGLGLHQGFKSLLASSYTKGRNSQLWLHALTLIIARSQRFVRRSGAYIKQQDLMIPARMLNALGKCTVM